MAVAMFDPADADFVTGDAVRSADETAALDADNTADEKGTDRDNGDGPGTTKVHMLDDSEEFINLRLRVYPIPPVVKTGDLCNDSNKHFLVFRLLCLLRSDRR
jgi:hypothetical protein